MNNESYYKNVIGSVPPIAPQPNQPPAYFQVQPQSAVIVQQPMMNVHIAAPLSHSSQRLTCPSCQAQIMTRVEYESSSKTHLIAFLLCLFVGCFGCCLIPYCKNFFHHFTVNWPLLWFYL